MAEEGRTVGKIVSVSADPASTRVEPVRLDQKTVGKIASVSNRNRLFQAHTGTIQTELRSAQTLVLNKGWAHFETLEEMKKAANIENQPATVRRPLIKGRIYFGRVIHRRVERPLRDLTKF